MALAQKQPAQSSKVVQNAATFGDMMPQLVELVEDKPLGLLASRAIICVNPFDNFKFTWSGSLNLFQHAGEHPEVLMGALDGIEGILGHALRQVNADVVLLDMRGNLYAVHERVVGVRSR